jgi:hypothetical protein
MFMATEDAELCQCPIMGGARLLAKAILSLDHDGRTAHMIDRLNDEGGAVEDYSCAADGCMMWRRKEPNEDGPNELPLGYCGLAGRPQC